MKHDFLTTGWKYPGRLLTAIVATVFLTAAGMDLWAAEASGDRESFITLDSEIQAIKAEILAINQEILLLEESSLLRADEQLVIVIAVAGDSGLSPVFISLQLDGELLTEYSYSPGEGTALLAGGVHRLYAGLLAEGEYRLDVNIRGTRNGKKSFQQQHSATILKNEGRKYIELQLGPGKRKSQPGLTVRQWQP